MVGGPENGKAKRESLMQELPTLEGREKGEAGHAVLGDEVDSKEQESTRPLKTKRPGRCGAAKLSLEASGWRP
jgi:hypothetical protein